MREQEVKDTMLDLLEMHLPQLRQPGATLRMKLSKNSLMMRNFPRLPPMRE